MASEVVRPVIKILIDQIKEHLQYVTCSTKYVTNMTKKMMDLEIRTEDVKKHMESKNINNQEIPTAVPGWLSDVENLKKIVQSISIEAIGCFNVKMRYRAGRKALEATSRIEELFAKEFDWSDIPIPTGRVDPKSASPSTSTPSFSSSGGDLFKSRERAFNDALKLLQQDDNKSQVVALCGMGGVGKTTMLIQLKTAARDNQMFNYIVNLTIGRTPNMSSIQNDVSVNLGGGGLKEETETSRADTLCEKFKEILKDPKKKILVILDDVWENIDIKRIGLTSPLLERVKLLLSSRDSQICRDIADCSVFQEVKVDVIEEPEAQRFFSQITEVSEQIDHDKYQQGCEIVKKCGGLPFAIKTIGKTLKSEECGVWRDTLNRLKKKDVHDKVQEIISISYDYIRNDEDKEILLHCGLFLEDSDIPIEDLTRRAWGLDLLKNVSTFGEARDRTNVCVKNLKRANLLIDSDHVGYLKMHDLVLAFVLHRVSKGDHPWIINHRDVSEVGTHEISESCKMISLTCTHLSKIPIHLNYPNLSLLQLMHGNSSLTFPEDFYENMKNLKVIAYYDMQHPLLPRSLQFSSNLKSLCLYRCKVMYDWSFIGDLLNLEVLSFAHCDIRKLPSTIGNLIKLKLLDLTGCDHLLIDDGVFRNLENLEELYMRVSGNEANRLTDPNFEELKILLRQLCVLEIDFDKEKTLTNVSFKKLDKFKISVGAHMLERLMQRRRHNEILSVDGCTLDLVMNQSDLLDCKINELFKKTEKLHLQVEDMICLQDVLSNPYDQHSFFYLRDLQVSCCENLKHLFTIPVAIGLRKLERLKIISCSVLEALVYNDGSNINSGGEMITFEELKFLCLRNLPKLVSLFAVDNKVKLRQLAELVVNGLPNFTSIYPEKNNISAFFHSQVKTSKLEKLKISEMENLKHIWACDYGSSIEEEVHNISMLREIEVKECDSLVNLFPTNPMLLFNNLENLRVVECGSIEEIFNIDLEYVGHELGQLRSSLRTIEVIEANKLREVWRIKGGKNNSNSSLIRGFDVVERVNMWGCKRFRNLFTPTNTNIAFDMRALTHITIRCCGETLNRQEEEIEVLSRTQRDENISIIAVPSNLMHSFHYLHHLNLRSYNSVEVVFEVESNPSSTKLVTDTDKEQPLLPNLQSLYLFEMECMHQVWKWNKFLILQNQSSFRNLKEIDVAYCNRIKYLFSPLMAKLLSNLQKIEIRSCDGMEEVVSNRDYKDEEMSNSTTSFFPHLHSLSFNDMRNLKRIGGAGVGDEFKFSQVGVASWSLCQYSRDIHIYGCHTLSSVIPSNAIGQMQKLQDLMVESCHSLREVFETQGINNNKNSGGIISIRNDERNGDTNDTTLVIARPEITNVTQLSNLKRLLITDCDLLEHIFTFSTLESLKHLNELTIKECKAMKVIVKKEYREQNKVVVFHSLKILLLKDLQNLEGFFLGKADFEWPLLEEVKIIRCPRIMVFTSGKSTAPELKYVQTNLGKHSVECGLNFHLTTNLQQTQSESTTSSSATLDLERLPWSFHNLIELDYDDKQEVQCIIPSNELLQLQKLERIRLLKLNVAQVFDEPQTVVEIPNLRQVKLKTLWCLKYIWKSNHHGTALEFPNLTTISITICHRLKHVFTSSMVASLLQLQHLRIHACSRMEIIVKEEEEEEEETESECDAKVKKIVTFPCLKSLELEQLSRLEGFCLGMYDFSWPSLDTLKIIDCPNIKAFTKGQQLATPSLNIIDTSFGRCYITEDINSFISTKQKEGLQF